MKILVIVVVVGLLTGGSSTSRANVSSQSALNQGAGAPKVGVIKKPFVDGCSCALQSAADYKKHNERYLFLSDLDGKAQMNIDSQDVELKLAGETKTKGRIRVGSRHSETYKSGTTTVTIDYVVTKLCHPKDEGCEVTWYSASITVNRNGSLQKIDVLGLCGC